MLFVQSKIRRVSASGILCWAPGRVHWVEMKVIYPLYFVSAFRFGDHIFFSSLGSLRLVDCGWVKCLSFVASEQCSLLPPCALEW